MSIALCFPCYGLEAGRLALAQFALRSRPELIVESKIDEEQAIQEALDEHCDKLVMLVKKAHNRRRPRHGVWQFDWLPGYYVKYGIRRFETAQMLAQSIQENGLDLIQVPEKRLFHIKGRPRAGPMNVII